MKKIFSSSHKTHKVFCIGYNKTGTTTLEKVLLKLGYRMPKQSTQETRVVRELFQGNYKPLITLCERYEAFQDNPFSQGVTYAALDALFPDSKFILTVREPNAWFESLTRFHLQGILRRAGVNKLEDFREISFKDKSIYLDKGYMHDVTKRHAAYVKDLKVKYDWSLVYNKKHRIDMFERRNEEIIKHFQDRQNQLLVIDLSKATDNSEILNFLDLRNKPIEPLPHLNKSKQHHRT